MLSIQIDVPDSLQEFIQSRIEEGEYGSPSEYFQALVRADQQVREALVPYTRGQPLESLILEGIESGDAGPLASEDWEALRRPFRERLAQAENR